MPDEITIFCMTGPRHPGKRKPVAKFRRGTGIFAGWHAVSGAEGQAILDDAPAPDGWADAGIEGKYRERYKLACPRCGGMSSETIRDDRLQDALDKIHAAGMDTCSLSGLRTIVTK